MRKKLTFIILALTFVGLTTNIFAGKDTSSADTSRQKETSTLLNKDIIAGSWKQLKGKIQQKWAKLTNDDVLRMKGTRTELEGILQEKYGYTKEEAERSINEFLEENKAYLLQDDKK